MRAKSIAVLIISTVALLLFAGVAHANAEPWPTTPRVLESVDFEGPETLAVYDDFGGFPPGPATWGLQTYQYNSPTHGLWCAGDGGTWSSGYPYGTRGLAVFDAPDTSGYYQSWLEYSYAEPTVEPYAGGINPFVVNWSTTATGSSGGGYMDTTLLPTSGMTKTLERGVFGKPPTSAGYLRFQFTSDSSLGSGGSYYQGATVDDVLATGYKFSPVTSLTAARLPSPQTSVQVSWTAATSPSGATPRYRIWRHDISADTYSELTSTTATSVTDTGVDVSKTFEYVVQAWDAATGDWGEAETSPVVPVGSSSSTTITGTLEGSATTTDVPIGTDLDVIGTLMDNSSQPISGMSAAVTVQSSPDDSTWSPAAGVTEGPSGTYTGTVSVSASCYLRLSFAGSGGYDPSTSGPSIHVTAHLPTSYWQDMASDDASVDYGDSTTLSAHLKGESGNDLTGKASSVVLQTSPDGSSWTDSGATVTGGAGGIYSASSGALTSATYFRFHFEGDSEYQESTSSSVMVDVILPTSYWQDMAADPTSVDYGNSTTLSARLKGEGGSDLTGKASSVVLETSPDGSSWTDSGATVTEGAAGVYSASSGALTSATYFRFHFEGDSEYQESASSSVMVDVSIPTSYWQDMASQEATVAWGASTTLSAHLKGEGGSDLNGKALSVVLQTSPDGTSGWTDSAAAVTGSAGGIYSANSGVLKSATHFRFRFDGDSGYQASTSDAVVVNVLPPTPRFVNFSAAPRGVAWKGHTKLIAQLMLGDSPMTDLGGSSVVVQRVYYGTPYGGTAPFGVATNGAGVFWTTVSSEVRSFYRLCYRGTDTTPAAYTGWFYVEPRAVLTKPYVSKRAKRRYKYFPVVGKVSRVPVASRKVTLCFYHKEKKWVRKKVRRKIRGRWRRVWRRVKVTTWRKRARMYVRVGAGSGLATYRVRARMRYKGSWYVNASINDKYNRRITTWRRYFRVR